MTIKEKGYSHWEGELAEKKLPWWPITRFGIRSTFRKKFFKFFFFGALLPAVVFLVGIYISERLEDFRFMIRNQTNFLTVDPGYFKSYFTGDFLLFMMVAILVFCGSGLISDDLKHNSLQLYFSRPLKKGQYFLGKASVIFFFLFLVTLVPGLVFFIMKLIFAGNFKFFASYPWLPLSIIGYSVLVTLFFALYTLFLSSLSKNRRYVSILIFAVYIFSDIIFGIFYGIFRSPYFALISLKVNLQQIGAFIFNQKLPYSIPWIYSFLIIFSISLLAAVYLKNKVKEVTIIK
ncbi:MAG: ABC transporter permease subunit [Candidatus Aminicenantes bacterium]|nr:ABC transporter permease subunit [Candidatus Aminicenantes bacterium]